MGTDRSNPYFALKGISHIALVSSDMARTVDFYEGVLGMPLVMTLGPEVADPDSLWTDSPMVGPGTQHFFFDIGNDDLLAFFWFPNGTEASPGRGFPQDLSSVSSDGSLHHLAFQIDQSDLASVWETLEKNGVPFQFVAHSMYEVDTLREDAGVSLPVAPPGQSRRELIHDGLPVSSLEDVNEETYLASFYFQDPDGVQLEFAAWCEPGFTKAIESRNEIPTRTGGRRVRIASRS